MAFLASSSDFGHDDGGVRHVSHTSLPSGDNTFDSLQHGFSLNELKRGQESEKSDNLRGRTQRRLSRR